MSADREQRIAALRPLLTAVVHVLMPNLPLIDCARLANMVLNAAEVGDLSSANVMLDALQRVRDESERVRQIN